MIFSTLLVYPDPMKVEEKDNAPFEAQGKEAQRALSFAEERNTQHKRNNAPQSFCLLRSSLCTMPTQVQYAAMNASPIKFGTSGWRGLIADDFTFATVRLAVNAIADHINSKGAKGAKNPTVLVGYDTR